MSMMNKLAIASVLLGCAAFAQADYVTNGGFTGGSLTGWTGTSPFPWFGAAAGTELNFYSSASTEAGSSSPSVLSQDLSGLVAGKSYVLSFDVASEETFFGDTPDNGIVATIGGNTVISETNISAGYNQASWDHFTANFVAGADDTLALTGYDNPATLFVTHVSVTDAVMAVPSPSGMSVFAVALVPMFFRRRKK